MPRSWYPTILSLVGIDPADDVVYRGVKTQIDGINVWPMITNQTATSPREYLPITPVSILWRERYKLITDAKPTWRYTPNATHVPDDGIGCSAKLPCLFDILNVCANQTIPQYRLPDQQSRFLVVRHT